MTSKQAFFPFGDSRVPTALCNPLLAIARPCWTKQLTCLISRDDTVEIKDYFRSADVSLDDFLNDMQMYLACRDI